MCALLPAKSHGFGMRTGTKIKRRNEQLLRSLNAKGFGMADNNSVATNRLAVPVAIHRANKWVLEACYQHCCYAISPVMNWSACTFEPNGIIRWMERHPGTSSYVQAIGAIAAIDLALAIPLVQNRREARNNSSGQMRLSNAI
jgi:hypothetical protein